MKVGIVGTGPAALMAGSQLLLRGNQVTFFEHKKAAGRKFLVAGHGGFNLSHSESAAVFVSRYSHAEIRECVTQFDNQQLVAWLKFIGIETYRGSTGKIFPAKGIKPIEVLKAWLNWLESQGAVFQYQHRMIDFSNDGLLIQHQSGETWHAFDKIILALGGGSWSKTGSDAQWVALLESKDIEVVPLQPSNAGMNYVFKNSPESVEGEVIKNCSLSHGSTTRQGEITITSYGFEGGPVYFLNGSFREQPELPIIVDFKPQWTIAQVRDVILQAKNPSEALKKLKLSKAVIWLMKNELSKSDFIQPELLAKAVKEFFLQMESLRPMEEAISTSGGVSWRALNKDLSLKKLPNISICGEMLDWDAPTGGYLLQACFASGFCAGQIENGELKM